MAVRPDIDISDSADHATRYSGIEDAIAAAAEHDAVTRISRDGKRVAAIIPAADAALLERVRHPVQIAGDGGPVRVAEKIVVERPAGQKSARMWIDGELFEFATVDGFSVHPQRGSQPGVTLTIAAMSVTLTDQA